jgi:hypothetical protein
MCKSQLKHLEVEVQIIQLDRDSQVHILCTNEMIIWNQYFFKHLFLQEVTHIRLTLCCREYVWDMFITLLNSFMPWRALSNNISWFQVDYVEPVVSNIVNVFLLKGSSICLESLTLNLDMCSQNILRYAFLILISITELTTY